MLIIGAKGFAKEVLEILHQNGQTKNLCFYDDVNDDLPEKLYGQFPVLRTMEEAKTYFTQTSNQFVLGIGSPFLRKKLCDKFESIGGNLSSVISKNAEIGSFGILISTGCNILSGVKISNDVIIGKGTLVYYNSVITHDVKIGEFCEISPSTSILGRADIGNFVSIGAGSVIFPDVVIGSNSVIAAGAIVRNNIPANVMVAGIPAVVKKELM
ncbi:acetyltransferase [Kaistella faecalis]|uniref:acetyltransferase n=1 Tax=Kaistella faecalis TaxID=2852098 RepID=UPI001C4404DE|nr:acetyltransferase [Chryseobacterium faecale]UFK97092.1 acetyltransferase [Chryseobacterium faecale]